MADQQQMRGFPVEETGIYVLLGDVVLAVRAYAQSLDDPEAGALVHELASWLSGGEQATEPLRDGEPEALHEVHGAEPDDNGLSVERVEIYPDPPDDAKPKWYARSIDTGGFILKITNGSFDQDWVIQNAGERWPGVPIHLLKNGGEDSKWVEDGTRGVFPSKGPPVRRLWQASR